MNGYLLCGGLGSFAAALAHFACVVVGAPLYRLMGAPEPFIALAASGHWYPPVMTALIALLLSIAAFYAFAGSRGKSWPAMRWVLMGTALVYGLRAVSFPWLKAYFPDNSDVFWYITSALCLGLCWCYAIGGMSFQSLAKGQEGRI